MEFALNHCNQSCQFEHTLQKELYKGAYEFSHKTGWVRTLGFGTGISSGCMRVAAHIATIAECIIKGLANMFGALFSRRCDFFRGFDMLIRGVIVNLYLTPVVILDTIFSIFNDTVGALTIPQSTYNYRWSQFDNDRRTYCEENDDFYAKDAQLYGNNKIDDWDSNENNS